MLNNKKVLITNDDGVTAKGIYLLVKEVYKFTKDILVVAPKNENSAVSHKLTIKLGVSYEEIEPIYADVKTYALDGTPADCVKFSIVHLKYKPDIVLSGVNNGLNLGDDILYSGTIAACFEACLCGVRSIGFSTEINEQSLISNLDYIINSIDSDDRLKNRMILNVNIPQNFKGYMMTYQGRNPFDSYYEYSDGKYFSKGRALGKEMNQPLEADISCYHNGYISITPLTTDRTEWK